VDNGVSFVVKAVKMIFGKIRNQIVAIAPRTEALETPINQPKKVQNEYGWVHTEITVDNTRANDIG
jgi:hypothetical protein